MKSSKVLILSAILMGLVALVLLTTCGKDKTTEPPPCYTITADTTGMGTVDFSPDSSCYHSGTAVTLTAVARAGWAFDSWSGDTSTTANPLVLTIAGNISVTATFVPACYTVTADTTGMGTVEFSPDSSCYHSGTAVTLTAVARSGWAFDSWSGDTSTTVNPLVLTITGNISVTATFVQVYTLTVNIVPSLSGTVLIDPDINYFHPGDVVTLTAQAGAAYGFSHWVYGTEVRDVNPTTIVFGAADQEITSMFGSLEGEPDCADGYVDFWNGGCNSDPAVFQSIADGQIYIARSGLYDSGSRDTDWFRYIASDNRNLTFTGVADFPLQLAIIDGTDGCLSYTVLVLDVGNQGDTVSIAASVGPGIYWMWAGPSLFAGPWPCPQDYKVWFSAEQAVGAVSPTPGRKPLENELSNVK